jgi:acylglycerol lipase
VNSQGEGWDVGTGVAGFAWHAPRPRAVVLFQHGWGDYTQRHVGHAGQLVPCLLDHGFDVRGFDLRGNGRSPGRRGVVDVTAAVQDHLAARELLRRQPLPVFLMGHSLGGLVTATSALHDQRDVAGMVLLAGALKYDVGVALRTVARIGGRLAPTRPAPLADGGPITRDPDAQQRLDHDPLMSNRGGVPWLTAAGGAAVSHANWRHYPELVLPLLAVHGSADTSTDPAGSAELVATVSSADKELLVVDGGFHALLDDLDAEATVAAVLHWLDSRASGGSSHQPGQ